MNNSERGGLVRRGDLQESGNVYAPDSAPGEVNSCEMVVLQKVCTSVTELDQRSLVSHLAAVDVVPAILGERD